MPQRMYLNQKLKNASLWSNFIICNSSAYEYWSILCAVCLSHMRTFYSVNIFSCKIVEVYECLFVYHKNIEEFGYMFFLCHLQHHKVLCCSWWQRNASLQQFQHCAITQSSLLSRWNVHFRDETVIGIQKSLGIVSVVY